MIPAYPARANPFPVIAPVRPAVEGLAAAILLLSGLVDLPNAITAGPLSIQAVLTFCYFAASLPVAVIIPTTSPFIRFRVLPLILFVFMAATSLVWTNARQNGLQNVLVMATFVALMWMSQAATSAFRSFPDHLARWLSRSSVLAGIIYCGALVWSGPGSNLLFGARSIGLFALFAVAYHLAGWRYGSRVSLLLAIGFTLLVGASLSRLALGIAVVLFPISQIPTKKIIQGVRLLAVLGVCLFLSYEAFDRVDILRERFLLGDLSLKVGSLAINVSGRTAFWRVTMDSFEESPVFGKGAGSTEKLMESVFIDIKHPHSDYLRVLHDYGVVGLVLWGLTWLTLLFCLGRSWRAADLRGDPQARFRLFSFMAAVGFVLEMMMENAMVYIFVVAPLGLTIGAAIDNREPTLANRS